MMAQPESTAVEIALTLVLPSIIVILGAVTGARVSKLYGKPNKPLQM
jgi:hypothetical protein